MSTSGSTRPWTPASTLPGISDQCRRLGSRSQLYSERIFPVALRAWPGLFYVFAETNSRDDIFELNPADKSAYDAQPVTISLPPPADLVAGSVTIPANTVAGQKISITYQVSNNGTNQADGSVVRRPVPVSHKDLER